MKKIEAGAPLFTVFSVPNEMNLPHFYFDIKQYVDFVKTEVSKRFITGIR